MTKSVKLTGVVLILVLAVTGCHYAHRNIREMADHAGMNRNGNAMGFRHMSRWGYRNMNHCAQFMFAASGHDMRGSGRQGGMPWMNGQMGMGRGFHPGRAIRPMGPDQVGHRNMRIERIPNLTADQRKEIGDLRLKQMQEIDKLREETFAKMQTIREENRTKIESLLTPEQKKSLESASSAEGESR
jgi:hypothetical protein